MKPVALNIKRTLHRQNLASTLAEDLRGRIIRGELAGGTMLRQEQLAVDAEGLIISHLHRGAQVVELSSVELNEIFDLRLMLEPDLLARAIPRMSAESLAKSQALLDALDHAYATGDTSHWGMLNADFHLSLYEPSGRSVTLAFLRRISVQADRYIRLQITLTDAVSDGAQEHQRMFALSRDGDVPAATRLLTRHISRTREQLLRILSPRHAPGDGQVSDKR